MSVAKFTYRVEMLHGQDIRVVEADSFMQVDGWIIFSRARAIGGMAEYWRAKLDCVVAMETRINP